MWDKPLVQELTEAEASDDPALVTAALALMSLVDDIGSVAGKYQVPASGHSVAAGRDISVAAAGGSVGAEIIQGNVTPNR